MAEFALASERTARDRSIDDLASSQGSGASAQKGAASLQDRMGNQAVAQQGLDSLALEETFDESAIDDHEGEEGGAAREAEGGEEREAEDDPDKVAIPCNLVQTVTGWDPGDDKYGFQVRFNMSSTSGRVEDLTSNPLLVWRERVIYTRNDWPHRFQPNNPTVKPKDGIPFFSNNVTVEGPNSLTFDNARDTHWFPADRVVASDWGDGEGQRPLPAFMQSTQHYEYSLDGSSWYNFAGPFVVTRKIFRRDEDLYFQTEKSGVHTVTEPYKGD